MSTKQPITDDRARQFYVHATAWDMEDVPKSSGSANARNVLAREWDVWLAAHDAKVKRDAAREALGGLEEFIRTDMDEPHGDRAASRVWGYRDTHYPEETP